MIKVVAKVLVKEGKVEEFKAVAKKLVEASVADEGNIYYTLNVSVQNPREFAILECWENQDVLDLHMKTPHFLAAMGPLGELAEKEMTIELFAEV